MSLYVRKKEIRASATLLVAELGGYRKHRIGKINWLPKPQFLANT